MIFCCIIKSQYFSPNSTQLWMTFIFHTVTYVTYMSRGAKVSCHYYKSNQAEISLSLDISLGPAGSKWASPPPFFWKNIWQKYFFENIFVIFFRKIFLEKVFFRKYFWQQYFVQGHFRENIFLKNIFGENIFGSNILFKKIKKIFF